VNLILEKEQKEQFLVNMQQQGVEQKPESIGNYRF